MIDPQELIDTCRKLAAATPPPSEADLRRAISTAYYAVFHTLAASNAELIAGQPRSSMSAYAWERVYRRLDHGRARNNLRAVLNLLSPPGAFFVSTFIELQDLRQEADYDPNFTITYLISEHRQHHCPCRNCHPRLRPADSGGTSASGRAVDVRPALTHIAAAMRARG